MHENREDRNLVGCDKPILNALICFKMGRNVTVTQSIYSQRSIPGRCVSLSPVPAKPGRVEVSRGCPRNRGDC